MKRLIHSFIILIILFPCINFAQMARYQRCATTEYMDYLKKQEPKLSETLARNENIIRNFIASRAGEANETITIIPVVVHVIWNTKSQSISDAMIHSQIRVLNEDFRKTEGTPGFNSHWAGADTKFEFRLADRDPDGNPHTGINRVQTTKISWNYLTDNAQLKALSYWPSQNYLNIWVANLSGGLLGYAQFPGGNPATEGVVILWSAFGYNSPLSPFNLGRTTTHEVGHWLYLYHTWGDDTTCSGTDFCSDTPPCRSQFFSDVPVCPAPVQCSDSARQIENYMDYSDDGCMNLFTNDQTGRMSAALTALRPSLLVSYRQTIPVNSTGVDYTFITPGGTPFAVLNFSSLGTADSVTVEVRPGLKPLNIPPGSKAVSRYFDINANGTGFNATLTVYYNDDEVTGFASGDNNLHLFRFDGSTWTDLGGTVNTTENSVALAGVTDFSIWALADPADNPIPVELISFNSLVNTNNILLSWITASEINNHGFEIERAEVLTGNVTGEWESVAFVQGAGTATGPGYYSYSDEKLNPGNYLYRLKIIDDNGSFEYSNIINALVEAPVIYELAQNYPNPFNPATIIKYQLPVKEMVIIKVYDALGTEVATLINKIEEPGIHEISFDASALPSGVYFCRMHSGSFMQTNKMLLMK